MTNPIRPIYDKLPPEVRTRIRSMFPDDFLRWYAHQKADVYLISYPKSGRTWLRLLIGYAITKHYSLPEQEDTLLLNTRKKLHPDVPRIVVIHDDRPMLKTPEELDTNKEKFKDKKVIFLTRDPRDVIVSSYFEMSRRGEIFGANPYEQRQAVYKGSLSDFIHRDIGGFDTIIRFYNIWAQNRTVPKGFLLVRYEDMKADAHKELRRTLDFLGLQDIRDDEIADAVAFASFDHMRQMEQDGYFQSAILKPADKKDNTSYKTRKGKIGGYREHLNDLEIAELNVKIQQDLSDFYGYN